MNPSLPELQILPLDKLILHEDHDLQRTLPLVGKLRAQGILRNPPIVMPLTDDSGRYMVLDGANDAGLTVNVNAYPGGANDAPMPDAPAVLEAA